MTTSFRLVSLAVCATITAGCLQSESAQTEARAQLPASGTSKAGPETPTEQFLFIADGIDEQIKQQLQAEIIQLIERSAVGTRIHIVRTPDHTVLASFEIPEAKGRSRMRSKALAEALPVIRAFLDDKGLVPTDFQSQLCLPRLAESFWGLRSTELPVRITLVGSPVFHDPQQSQWSFRKSKYPSDSSLTDAGSTMPYKLLGRQPLPSTAEIVWLTEKENWGDSKAHEDAIVRFSRHAFSKELGGELLRMTSDLSAAFSPDVVSAYPPLDELNDALPPSMIQLPPSDPTPFPESSRPAVSEDIPEALRSVFEETVRNHRQSLVAINWTSEFADTDMDLWITGPDKVEMNFKTMTTSWGKLIRDVRRTGDLADVDILGNWEVAVLDNVDSSSMEFWMNAYLATPGPVEMKLITVVQGQTKTTNFTFNVEHSDNAGDRDRRSDSKAWMKLTVL